MFWDESDLKELQATAVAGALYECEYLTQAGLCLIMGSADKIGKDDVENEYRSRIVPLLSVCYFIYSNKMLRSSD